MSLTAPVTGCLQLLAHSPLRDVQAEFQVHGNIDEQHLLTGLPLTALVLTAQLFAGAACTGTPVYLAGPVDVTLSPDQPTTSVSLRFIGNGAIAIDGTFEGACRQSLDLDVTRLPSEQGWTFGTNNQTLGLGEGSIFAPCAGPVLCLNSLFVPFLPNDGTAFNYTRVDVANTTPFIIEMRARILDELTDSSRSDTNAFGLYLSASTGTENFALGIGSNPPRIQTSSTSQEAVPFDTRDFHLYRLAVKPGVGFDVFVDDQTTPLRSGPPAPSAGPAGLTFGDGSSFNAVRAEIAALHYCSN